MLVLKTCIVLKTDFINKCSINIPSYFIKTWLERFDIEDWCVGSLRVRTNNSIEGFNNKLKRYFRRNPTPWDFVETLHRIVTDIYVVFLNDEVELRRRLGRSRLTGPLILARNQLRNGEITIYRFLARMSAI